MLPLPGIDDLGDIEGKRVLVRVDFNTPLVEVAGELTVSDDFRIRSAVVLFNELQSRGAQVVACTHLGRPNGRINTEYSVEPLRRRLNELCPGVTLLENLRFDLGEEANSLEFGQRLCEGFDAFVNEAFGVSHRQHASIMVPPKLLPSVAGPNMLLEVSTLLGVFNEPQRPLVAIVGGAKVHDKLAITKKLSEKADRVLVGGGMAFTFWRALGRSIGDSLVDDDQVEACRALLESGKIVIPEDALGLRTGSSFGAEHNDEEVIAFDCEIPDGFLGLDIGVQTRHNFAQEIGAAGTILWNGPMGVFEDNRLSGGTRSIAEAIAASTATSIIGGGDSAAAVAAFGMMDSFDFISTGGGASLELMELGDLPGLRAIRECAWN